MDAMRSNLSHSMVRESHTAEGEDATAEAALSAAELRPSWLGWRWVGWGGAARQAGRETQDGGDWARWGELEGQAERGTATVQCTRAAKGLSQSGVASRFVLALCPAAGSVVIHVRWFLAGREGDR